VIVFLQRCSNSLQKGSGINDFCRFATYKAGAVPVSGVFDCRMQTPVAHIGLTLEE
jgi:hypothetical protein